MSHFKISYTTCLSYILVIFYLCYIYGIIDICFIFSYFPPYFILLLCNLIIVFMGSICIFIIFLFKILKIFDITPSQVTTVPSLHLFYSHTCINLFIN